MIFYDDENYVELDDNELIRLTHQNDSHAFSALLKKYRPIIYKQHFYAKRLYLDFADYYQEAAICLLQTALKYSSQSGASFGTYFKWCLTNKLRDDQRKVHSDKRLANYQALSLHNSVSEEQELWMDRLISKDSALQPGYITKVRYYMSAYYQLLSPFEMRVFQLYAQNKSREEVAKILEVSPQKVIAAYGRCRQKFKKIIFANHII